MDWSKKILGVGGESNMVGIKVSQLNVLLEQLRSLLAISQIPA